MTTVSALTDIFSSDFQDIDIWTLDFKSAKQQDQKLPGYEVVMF